MKGRQIRIDMQLSPSAARWGDTAVEDLSSGNPVLHSVDAPSTFSSLRSLPSMRSLIYKGDTSTRHRHW